MPKPSALFVALTLAGACIAAVLGAAAQPAAPQNTSLFPDSTDIGITQPGATTWNPATQTYELTGGGADMWGGADAFRFAWTRISGDATLTATVVFPPGSHPPNEKAVLIFRQSLDPSSPYADVAIHADHHITLQWRSNLGMFTQDVTAPSSTFGPIGISRHGNRFTAFATQRSGTLIDAQNKFAHVDLTLPDPVYIGIGVCAHDADGLATVTFSDVHLSSSATNP
jgi:TolB protein